MFHLFLIYQLLFKLYQLLFYENLKVKFIVAPFLVTDIKKNHPDVNVKKSSMKRLEQGALDASKNQSAHIQKPDLRHAEN
jgi:hypothetical protein